MVLMTKFKNQLVSKGYDGIIFKNSTIDCNPNERHTIYIVFNAESILYANKRGNMSTNTYKNN